MLLFATSFLSCDKDDDEDLNDMDDPKTEVECAEVMETLVKNDNNFGFKLFQEINALEGEDVNIFASSLSVATAMAMTYNGASNATAAEMKDGLLLDNLTDEEINEGYKCLLETLADLDEQVVLDIANSIWCREGYPVREDFFNTNQDYFQSEVKSLDFNDPESVEIINTWIADNTNDKILDMLDMIPADAVMYLINAIYFRGTWKYEFDEELTQAGDFYKEDNTAITVNYMKQQADFDFLVTDAFTAIDLPYGNHDYSMTIFLPEYGHTVNEVIADLSEENWNTWLADFEETEVVLTMPKFNVEYKTLLNESLQNIGIQRAFEENSDNFLNINDDALYISRVIHQSFIEVSEVGTEAAAATIVEIVTESAEPNQPPHLSLNRPFFFVIREHVKGTVLFLGKIVEPGS